MNTEYLNSDVGTRSKNGVFDETKTCNHNLACESRVRLVQIMWENLINT